MRLGVTIAEKSNGEWVTLADPSVPLDEQKALRKKIAGAGGKHGKESYKRLYIFNTSGQVKRSKFVKQLKEEKNNETVSDDLTQMAEAELNDVIKDEKLKVKFSRNHEKVRDAIRAARADKPEPVTEPEPEQVVEPEK